MSYIDTNRPAPFGAITIYRATTALSNALDTVGTRLARRARTLSAFTPTQLEDLGLSVADVADARPGILTRFAGAIGDWNARRRTINELGRLSDAQLDDIGLTRAHIEDMRFGRPLI